MFTNLSKKRGFVKENNDNYKVEEMDYQIDVIFIQAEQINFWSFSSPEFRNFWYKSEGESD